LSKNSNLYAMARIPRRSLSRSAVAAYLCICAALVLLLALTIWGAYRDLNSLRAALLNAELNRLRSLAERTVGRLERDLETGDDKQLTTLGESHWLKRRWERVAKDDSQMYAAIVGNDSRIDHHTRPSLVGQRLPNDWYDQVAAELGDDVVVTKPSDFSLGRVAYDVHVPIILNGQEVGEYHAGMNLSAVQNQLAQYERAFLQRRALLVGGVLLIVLLATTSLYYIATHSVSLRKTIDQDSIERATEVGALVAGLAHEIRNPLHAIQLNLHTLRRAQTRKQVLAADEMETLLEESIHEIDRIEGLMQQLVGFATPDQPREEVIDLASEVNGVVDFLHHELLRSNIEVETELPSQRVDVRMDHGRLRQVMLNLLQNAQQAMEDGGRLRVTLRRHRGRAYLSIADNGPGIAEEDRRRIFKPFYSTKDNGTGLGLPLVKRFVEEADGEIDCRSNGSGGTTFRIVLPTAQDQ